MSTVAAAPAGAGADDPATGAAPPAQSGTLTVEAVIAIALCAGLVAIAVLTSSGVDLVTTSAATWTDIALTLLGTAAIVAGVVAAGRARAWGGGTVALLAAMTALTALSILWSVLPDGSWFAGNQALSYLAVFAGAAMLARLAPERWAAVAGGVLLACTALSAWALLARAFGGGSGRLQDPFGYYNAVGVIGALGMAPALWAGARQDHGRRLAGLAAPAIAVMLSAVILSYSRSADAVAVIAVGGWIAFVPLRLRAAATLAVGAIGAAIVSGWALSSHASGHTFGIVFAVVLAATTAAGVAVARAMDSVSVAEALRRRIGLVLVGGVALVPVLAIVAVAMSSRGLFGEISHAWTQLTSPTATVGNNAGRVLQFGSSRPLYWHQGLSVGEHNLFKGVGALGFGIARLRYTLVKWKVDQAHSYLIETFADLGLVGIVLTLALLAAWGRAALRAVGGWVSWRAIPPERRPEREALIALAMVVVAFGIQSALDWTWYFPGVSVLALVCAGWLTGRGPLTAPVGRAMRRRKLLDRPGAAALVVALAAVALLGAWVQWQPLRSLESYAAAQTASTNPEAFADTRAAIDEDPLALDPRLLLAHLYGSIGDRARARAEFVRATQIQSQNPLAWLELARFDLQTRQARQALSDVRRVLALDRTPDPTTMSAFTLRDQAEAQLARQK